MKKLTTFYKKHKNLIRGIISILLWFPMIFALSFITSHEKLFEFISSNTVSDSAVIFAGGVYFGISLVLACKSIVTLFKIFINE